MSFFFLGLGICGVPFADVIGHGAAVRIIVRMHLVAVALTHPGALQWDTAKMELPFTHLHPLEYGSAEGKMGFLSAAGDGG